MEKQDFGNFTTTLSNAKIIDSNYPVKGCYVWLPYGFELKEKVFSYIEKRIKEQGYQRYQFPRLIPGPAIRKVTKNIADFENGLFWLHRKDGTGSDLFLNPTGECGVYTMFEKWVRQISDLPLKLYQIGNTFRPHKRPNVLLNGDELTNLLEAHSAFSSSEKAETEFFKMITTFKEVHSAMGIPFLALRRPISGNKPVCVDMVSFETYLPSKNTSFNVGVLYDQGQIYSRAFGVSFVDNNGLKDNTYQVTFGISERGIAAMLDNHKDEYGLRLLPQFAPVQILIIPIYKGNNDAIVKEYAQSIQTMLQKRYSVLTDLSDREAGKKFALARQQGIPIRIGISEKDVLDKTVRLYLRTEQDPINEVLTDCLEYIIDDSFEKINDKIVLHARNLFNSKIFSASKLSDVSEGVKQGLFAKMYWCGNLSCLQEFSKTLPGELIGTQYDADNSGSCFICGKESLNPSFYARRGASP